MFPMDMDLICHSFREFYDLKNSQGENIGHLFFRMSSSPSVRKDEEADFDGYHVWRNPSKWTGWTKHLDWLGSSGAAARRCWERVQIDTTKLNRESWQLVLDKCEELYQTPDEEKHFVADWMLYRIAANRHKGECQKYWGNVIPANEINLWDYITSLGHEYPNPKGEAYLAFLRQELAEIKEMQDENPKEVINTKTIPSEPENQQEKSEQSKASDQTKTVSDTSIQTMQSTQATANSANMPVLKQNLQRSQMKPVSKADIKNLPGLDKAMNDIATSQTTDISPSLPNNQSVAVAQQVEEQKGFWSSWGWIIGIAATAGIGFLAWYFIKKYKDKAKKSESQSNSLKEQVSSLQDEINDLSNNSNSNNNNTNDTNNDNTLVHNSVTVNTDLVDKLNEILVGGNQRV